MIPTTQKLRSPLASLSAAALAFVAMLSEAHASDGAISTLQDHLGVLVYVALPFVFYALMRERRRRHGSRGFWRTTRHPRPLERARISRTLTSDIQASK
jgi:hypothetical protein